MTFTTVLRMACIVFVANGIAATAAAADHHNFILLMPEAMQSANVNDLETPALARLREEGVFYSRSFSGFPELTFADQSRSAARRAAELVAFTPERYATLMVDDEADEASMDRALSRLEEEHRPFILVYRLRGLDAAATADPKSLFSANPGGEGAAGTLLLNTDRLLAAVESQLRDRGLYDTTNIVVLAEHGRSTIWKQSRSSYTHEMSFGGVPSGNLPPGFLAIDLVRAMLHEDAGLSLYDPDRNGERVNWWDGHHPSSGNAVIAVSRTKPHVTIEAHGGYDAIFMPEELDKREVARRGRFIVDHLLEQDYVSGVFVNEERLGRLDGTLSLKYLGANAEDDSGEQVPDIVVNFTSATMRCGHPTICAASIADTPVQEGQDMALGFSRAETSSFMAARGPDFRVAFNSRTPASPADMIRTIGALAGLRASPASKKDARDLTETLRGFEKRAEPRVHSRVVASKASDAGEFAEAHLLSVNGLDYLEAAGAPGRSVGVPAREPPYAWHWEWPWKTFEISIKP